MTETSTRNRPLIPGIPDVLERLWNEMNEDSHNSFNRYVWRDDKGGFCLVAERSNGSDHKMLFHLDSEADTTLRVVQGLDFDRCALGLSRRPADPPSRRRPRLITKGMARLVTFPTGLELYFVEIPESSRMPADELLGDFNSLEHYVYEGRHLVGSQPFDPSTDPFARLVPYLVHARAGETTWASPPR